MGFSRKLNRKQSHDKQETFLTVPVLNELNTNMQVPISYRNNLLNHYGLSISSLTGVTSFHIIFVIEGVVFGFFTKHGEQVRVTLHVLELDDEESIKLVGSEIFTYWTNLKTALTFEELKSRYSEMSGNMS